MKNKKIIFGIAIIVVLIFSTTSCFGQGNSGGGRTFNNAEDLKKYLDSQPANSPDKPIKVSMTANAPMLPKIAEAINSAGKYVSLNLTGNLLTTIENFIDCKMLVSITIPNSVTIIEDSAFSDCTSLASVTIPNSVTIIGFAAFQGCTSLTGITIPNSVTSLKNYAFCDCASLAKVTIPESVNSIGVEAFSGCKSLSSVMFQGTISSDNFGFYNKNSKEWYSPFDGDLRDKYLAGGIGTYTTTAPVGLYSKWTKQ